MSHSWLVELALDVLKIGEQEPYVVPEEALELLSAGVAVVVHHGGDRIKSELEALLKLADVLRRKHRSPSAADRLYRAIEMEPRAIGILGLEAEPRSLAVEQKRAPKYGAPAPPGTQKLSTFTAHHKGAKRS